MWWSMVVQAGEEEGRRSDRIEDAFIYIVLAPRGNCRGVLKTKKKKIDKTRRRKKTEGFC